MKYQILALDLDGTLTNSKKEISEPTREALIDIQKQGKRVILASGRPTTGVLPLVKELRLDEFGSYILTFNGGRIIECRTGNVIYNKLLPDDVAAPLFHIVKKYSGVDILAYRDDCILSGLRPNEYSEKEAAINNMPIVVTDNFPLDVPETSNKYLVTGNPDILMRVQKEAEEHFRSYLSIYCSDPFFLEIMPAGVDKAHSLLRLLTATGLTADEMICCGDGCNDIAMLETAGLGVAMANAQPQVLERADYITRSNDEDGVLHVIDTFMRDS